VVCSWQVGPMLLHSNVLLVTVLFCSNVLLVTMEMKSTSRCITTVICRLLLSQNCRFWGTENPRELHQHQLHPQKCTVWCGVMAEWVIGPYFFENEEGQPERISGPLYRKMLENVLRPAVEDNQEVWFQQDGATAHTARAPMDFLREMFGERII
jgi:hypothetical protein